MEQRAIDQANSLGALVVVAAGNDGTDVSGYSPANCRGVLVVGASGATGGAAQYANYGEAVTLSAPGSAIASLANTGVRGVDPSGWTVLTRSGTSMAAPHVSAVAALLWSRAPQLSAAQVRSILVQTATPFAVPTSGFGVGIVDAAKAVDAALPPTSPDLPRPVVRSISPAVARTPGGDRITITGSGLMGASVLIGGRPADVVFGDATTLVVTAPAGAVGATQVLISTAGGSAVLPFGYDARYVVGRSDSGSKLTPHP